VSAFRGLHVDGVSQPSTRGLGPLGANRLALIESGQAG